MKKICSNQKGVKAVHKFPALLKRLHNLVDELTRKANIEKRLDFGYESLFPLESSLLLKESGMIYDPQMMFLILYCCRNHRAITIRENTERRLREAVELLKLITNG